MDILLNGILRLVILTSVMFTHVCEGQEITGPTPATQAIINGTTHRLTCSRSSGTPNMISWFKSPNFNLFLGTQKLVFDEQFDNFGVEQVNTDQLDLVITDMIIEDAGGYYCQLAGTVTISDTATRTVEVEVDSMKMMIDGIEVSPPIDVIEDVASEVVCEAKGARPAVDIEWFEIKDNIQAPITSGFDQTSGSTDGGDTFDTLSTLSYITNKDYNGGTLKCITTGQDVASPKTKEASLAVQYKPDVTVSWNDPIVICSSDANPEVVDSNDFVIIANGIDAYTPEFKDGSSRLQLNIEENTHIRCNVTNSIGMGTADTIAVPGATTPEPPTLSATTKPLETEGGPNIGAIVGGVFAGLLVVVVIVLLVYFLVVKKKKPINNKTKNSSGSEMKPVNGSDDKAKPVPAPRSNSKGDAQPLKDNDERKSTDNPDGLVYAAVDHSKSNQRPTNNIIRTEEATEYADVKTFIRGSSSSS